MPTHLDRHIPYAEDDADKPVEEKSQGPILLVVGLTLFVLVIYFMFVR